MTSILSEKCSAHKLCMILRGAPQLTIVASLPWSTISPLEMGMVYGSIWTSSTKNDEHPIEYLLIYTNSLAPKRSLDLLKRLLPRASPLLGVDHLASSPK